MAGEFPHLSVSQFFNPRAYTYPSPIGGGGIDIVERNRAVHGSKVIEQLNAISKQFNITEELPENVVKDDAVYVEFYSEWGYELKYDSFNQEINNPKYQLLQVKKETIEDDNETKTRDKIVVMMRPGGVSQFLKKAGEYLVKNTKDREKNDTGLPSHRALINNIEAIKLATLRSFWADEPEIPFPPENELRWWEVWFRKNNGIVDLEKVVANLSAQNIEISKNRLEFPEHVVRLVKATANQLSKSVFLLDNLAELRQPQQLNDFITHKSIDIETKSQWLSDLNDRLSSVYQDHSVVVCLLDTGINRMHPLLSQNTPDERLFTYNDSWGTDDTWPGGGHGTGVAGLALFGDLTEALSSQHNIRLLHRVESFKIVHPDVANDPELYGAITEYACSVPVATFPHNQRIFCLTLTDKNLAMRGRPSTWSASIDKISCGTAMGSEFLFIVSSGNVEYLRPGIQSANYSSLNLTESVHDPAQSYNALTVGSYTRLTVVDPAAFPGITALAPHGGMSPSNSTSLTWESQWPVKPDIVMEGGNLGVEGTSLRDDVPTLMPLSLDKDFLNYLFMPFGDTSGAAALASNLASEVMSLYPSFWPETVRGLIVHSAEWTNEMLNGINLQGATNTQKMALLRSFGFGVPIRDKLLQSARNSATLIAQNYIQPYRMDGSSDKTNEYHLYKLPWPSDVLLNNLSDQDVKLKVTLSYFIDPNPGNKRYANDFSYHSHSLDFKMIRRTENIDEFKRRISASEGGDDVEYHGEDEPWILKEAIRNRGSVKKDFVITSGADLSTRDVLAVYPKRGWYRTRKKLGLVDTQVRYSLVISIESSEENIDIYTPIKELIETAIEIPITV